MNTQPENSLTIDEMSGVFRALCGDDPAYTIEHGLRDTLPLAKSRGIDASQFTAQLEASGIRCTENFRQWLAQKFAEGETA